VVQARVWEAGSLEEHVAGNDEREANIVGATARQS